MSPKQDPQTAATWRRTRHLGEALSLISYLDGSRTVPEAAEQAGLPNPTIGWRIMASLRYLATEKPELVNLVEQREGRKVYYTVELLPGSTATKKMRRRKR